MKICRRETVKGINSLRCKFICQGFFFIIVFLFFNTSTLKYPLHALYIFHAHCIALQGRYLIWITPFLTQRFYENFNFLKYLNLIKFICKFDLKILRTEINLKKIEIIYIIGLSNSNITIIRKYWEIQHFKFYFFYSKFEQHVISHKDYSMTGLYLIWSNSLNNFNQFFNNIV